MGGALQPGSPTELKRWLTQLPVIWTLSRSQGYQRAGLLSAEDVTLIQRVAGQRSQADKVLEEVSRSQSLDGRRPALTFALLVACRRARPTPTCTSVY